MADLLPADTPLPDVKPVLRNPLAGYLDGTAPQSNVVQMPQRGGGVQQQVRQLWLDAGYSPAAVEGIMRRVNEESSFDPHAIGDDGTSFGLYQHHADRAVRLQQWSEQHGLNPGDPTVQTKFAIAEMAGLDPIAARHRDELMKATDPGVARGIFTASFERPQGAPGSEETNLKSTAVGGFTGAARGLLAQWAGDIQRRGQEYDRAIAESKDLHSASRAALLRWEDESNKPPQNMREAWNSWAGIATALATFGGLFGRRSITASLNAAGEMLQAANAADQRAYDRSYQQWKDHLDRGLKLIDLLNRDARDIVDDASKSYDRKVSELQTLSAAYGLEKQLDPASVENLTKNLQLARQRQELIQAQNVDSDIRNYKAEKIEEYKKQNNGAEPPASKLLEWRGEAERTAKGTAPPGQAFLDNETAAFMARQYLAGDKSVLTGLGFGNVGAANRAKVREAIKTIGEQMHLSPEEITTRQAEFEGTKAGERTLGTLTATTEKFTQEASRMADLVLSASAAFPRGQFPGINSVFNRIKEGTGDTQIVRLNAAINSFINVYAKAVNPTGAATVSDKEHVREMLSSAQTPEQLAAVIDQLKAEMQAARESLPAVRQEFREGVSTRAGASAPSALPSDLPSPAGHAEGSVAKDETGKVVAVIRGGRWAAP